MSVPPLPDQPRQRGTPLARLARWVLALILAIGLVAGLWRVAPWVCALYGYRPTQVDVWGSGLWHLEVIEERRRADWLPIPERRVRFENLFDEEIARFDPDEIGMESSNFRGCHASLHEVRVFWDDRTMRFVPDARGALVPEGSLPPASEEESVYTPFEGLRLHPVEK